MPSWRRDGLTLIDRSAIRLVTRLAGEPAIGDFYASLCNLVRDYGRSKALRATVGYYFIRRGRGPETFVVSGETYTYCREEYNATWSNERAVEIPLAQERIRRANRKRILEIGNVLAYYGPIAHEVVDKYEHAEGVRNIDVVDIPSTTPYDLIISISTLEHVGWDEVPRDPGKLLRAVTHLTGLLAPGGELFVTMPLGANPHVAELIELEALQFDTLTALQRTSPDNRWVETRWDAVRHAKYGNPYHNANAIVIGSTRNSG